MASTRNKNTPNNYFLEMQQYGASESRNLYKYGANGHAYDPKLPGLGFGPAGMPQDCLSYNAIDTESFLYGINSTNLINPVREFTPEFKQVPVLNLIDKRNVIMPTPFIVSKNNRPTY